MDAEEPECQFPTEEEISADNIKASSTEKGLDENRNELQESTITKHFLALMQ